MIIHALCNSCLQKFDLIVEPSQVHLVKEISDENGETCPCPRLCGGRINLFGDGLIQQMGAVPGLRDPISITGKQLYQAVNGLGLPDEIPKNREVIDSLLRSQKIVSTVIDELDGKVFIHELRLEDGLTIHLAAGLRGAQVFKITKETKNGG